MLSKVSHCVFLCMLVLLPSPTTTTTTRAFAVVQKKFSYCFQQPEQQRQRTRLLLCHHYTNHVVTCAVTAGRSSRQPQQLAAAAVRRRCVSDRRSSITNNMMSAAAASREEDSIPAVVSNAASYSSSTTKHHEQEEKMMMRRLVVVLAGPTAVGKSRVAAKLCANLQQQQQHYQHHHYGGMIVSADSVQAYRGVEIGANKPTLAEREETPHILLDVADADDTKYNAAEWTCDALYAIQKLLLVQNDNNNDNNNIDDDDNDMDEQEALDAKQRQVAINNVIQQARLQKSIPLDSPVVPIVVGGTMMYLTWLVHGRPDALRPSDSAMQKAETEMAKYQSTSDWDGAVQAVGALGSTFALQIQKLCGNDWYRLRRILEVAYTSIEEKQQGSNNNNNNNNNDEKDDDDESKVTQKLYSGEREGGLLSLSSSYDVRCFFLCPNDRMQHAKVIDERCEQMLRRGLISETANLWITGKLPDMASKAIGYRQTLDYLQRPNARNDDKTAFGAYLQDFCTATRRYSKKQMQWFRKDEEFVFVPISLDTVKSASSAASEHSTTITATDHVSKEIQRMLNLSRPDFDKERLDQAGISQETRRRNEAQGAKMKVYQHEPQILLEDSKELEAILQQADDCTNRVQAKKPRR